MTCFWTSLVNAIQECEEEPAPEGALIVAASSYSGGAASAVIFNFDGCEVDLTGASSIAINGYAMTGDLDPPLSDYCGQTMEGLEFVDIDPPVAMDFETYGIGSWSTEHFFSLDIFGYMVIRVSVDGGADTYLLLYSSAGF